MYKTIRDVDINYNDAPLLSLIDLHSKGVDSDYMTKRAGVLTKEIQEIKPEKNASFLHIVAMGAGDYYGCNKNSDWFNETNRKFTFPEPKHEKVASLGGGLLEYYPTFKSNANVFKEHANKDPSIRRGIVKSAAYNEVTKRVELIVKVDNDMCGRELNKLASGKDVMFSMACNIPHDTCSICGNKASKPEQYCNHINNELGHVKSSGHKVMMINDRPNFFDISFVAIPADRIAGTLAKIASFQSMPIMRAPLSVFLHAGDSTTRSKAAALNKLAEIEKVIMGDIEGAKGKLEAGLPDEDLPKGFVDDMCGCGSSDSIESLNDKGVMLSMPDFFKMVLGDNASAVSGDMDSAEASLPGIFNRLKESGDLDELFGHDEFSSIIDGKGSKLNVPDSIIASHGMDEEPVVHRSIKITISPKNIDKGRKKRASIVTPRGEYLAKEYAKYSITYANTNSELANNLLVLNNCI